MSTNRFATALTRVVVSSIVLLGFAVYSVNADDFVQLFDGKTLKGWRGYRTKEIGKGWKVEDGQLMLDGRGGDIITEDEYQDFELHLEWKISPGGNSGIMYRVSLGDGAPYISGPEYQLLDDGKHGDGRREMTSAGALYALYKPVGKVLKPVGEYNQTKIILRGNHVEHWLNGVKIVEAELGSDDWNQRVAKSKFSGWSKFGKNRSGHISLQDHGDKIWFREIKIKRLSSEGRHP